MIVAAFSTMLVAQVAVANGGAPPLQFWMGGHDGLTQRFFAAVAGPDQVAADCSRSCIVVTIDQTRPEGSGRFSWRVEIDETSHSGRGVLHLGELTGLCAEEDITNCAVDVRARIDAVAATRSF